MPDPFERLFSQNLDYFRSYKTLVEPGYKDYPIEFMVDFHWINPTGKYMWLLNYVFFFIMVDFWMMVDFWIMFDIWFMVDFWNMGDFWITGGGDR